MAKNKPPRRLKLVERMRAHGVRVTSPRRAIAHVLESADEHLDVEEITDRARAIDPSVHRATVYRTMALLKDLSLVDELDLLHLHGDRHYYEVRAGSQHAHVICTECSRVVEPGGALLRSLMQALSEETGIQIEFYRLEAGGLCSQCLEQRISRDARGASERR
jgi:Fur family ferric uptake transcriptional regulator